MGDTGAPPKVPSGVILAALLEHNDVDWGVYVALTSYISQNALSFESVSTPDGASASMPSITQIQTVANDARKRFEERQLFEVVPGKMAVDKTGEDLTELQTT